MDFEHFNNFINDMADLDAFEDWKQCSIQLQQKQTTPTPKKSLPRVRRRRFFNPLRDLRELQFREKYRYTKENMRRIVELLRDDDLESAPPLAAIDHRRRNQVPYELQIMTAIRFWARTEHPEITASVHSVTRRTLTKICRRVASALAAKASRYIRMPSTLSEKQRVIDGFQALAGMPQVIGAVAHTSVRFRRHSSYEAGAGEGESEAEETGPRRQAQNIQIYIQIVSDATHKIRDLDCRLLSSLSETAHYAHKMFKRTRIKERFEQNEFRGRFLLADERFFACTPFLFTPVQWPKAPEQQSFNRSHAATFAPVAHCLNAWMQRFGILNSEICSASFGTARHTIVALALLHNMAVEWNDPSLDGSFNGFSAVESAGGCSYSVGSSPMSAASENSDDAHARLEFIRHNF